MGVFAAVWRNLFTALGDQPPAVAAPADDPDPARAAPPGIAVPIPET